MSDKLKSILKGLLKITVTCLALWVVSLKVNLDEVVEILPTLNWFYVAICVVLNVLVFVIAALRLNSIYRSIGIWFSQKFNLKLYFLGLFYNLFLPGGMGGDAYKIYLLKKSKVSSLGKLFKSSLLDRATGAWALLVLAALLTLFIDDFQFKAWVVGGVVVFTLGFCLALYLFLKMFRKVIPVALVMSLLLQAIALGAVVLALKAMHVEQDYILFLLGFVVSALSIMIPFSIGGLGLRELAFVYMADLLHIDAHIGVILSLLVYLSTSLVSLAGAYYVFNFSKIKDGLVLESSPQ